MMEKALAEALDRGIELFNKQEFYEAHEIWEIQWNEEQGDERRLLQGLIQVAAGFYKLQVGMPSGTYKLLYKGIEHLELIKDGPWGLELPKLLEEASWWRDKAQEMVELFATAYDKDRLPTLSRQCH